MRFKGRGDKPSFQASVQPDGTLEMLIYEDIGEDYWSYSGGITAKTIRQQIDGAPNAARITVRIDSDGGDAFDGIAIYNVLRASKKPIDVFVDGLAASAASIIAMAGDTITMGINTCMMIHNAASFLYGDANYLRKQADALDTVSTAIAQTYVAKTGKPLAEIQELMDNETWMTAQACLEAKFCTALTDDGVEQPDVVDARKRTITARLVRYKAKAAAPTAPAPAASPANETGKCACDCSACMDGNCANCSDVDCSDANCENCPMQEGASAETERAKLNLQLRKLKAASR